MRILVVANNKGGVGKTSLSVILSLYFARQGKRVLGMDFDPQCNYSGQFVKMELDPNDQEIVRPPIHPDYEPGVENWTGRNSTADIFSNGFAVTYSTAYENLEVIPGHSKELLQVERVTQQEMTARVHKRLVEWFSTWEEELYDIVIIDTGPSKGPLTTAALYAASDILIPAEMEELSVEGLYGMLAYWSQTNLQRPKDQPLKLIGILANKYDARLPIHQHYYEALSSHPRIGSYVLPVVMHNWQDYKESMMRDSKPVLYLSPSNRTRIETEEVCKIIEERMYGNLERRQ